MMTKCEMVVGFTCNPEGDIVGEIECVNQARWLVEGAKACESCRDAMLKEEPDFKVRPLP